LARRAESRRISHNNPGVREAKNDQQRNRHLNPETRSRKQSVDTFRRAAAREDEEVREAENEQQRNRQSVPEHREQEQSGNVDKFETNAAWFANAWSYVIVRIIKG
jgi:hypothetical protein